MIIGEQLGPDEEEHKGNRHVKQAAQPDAFASFPIRAGGDVPLDETLVDAEILQIENDSIDQNHPKSGLGKGRAKAAQAELMVFHAEGEDLAGAVGHIRQHDQGAQAGAGHQHECLKGVRPDHRDNASHEGIDGNGNSRDQDDDPDIPAEQDTQRQGHQIHDGSHAGQLRQEIKHAGIDPCPGTETVFQVGIGGNLAGPAVVGHKEPYRDPGGNRQGKAKNKGIPIGSIGLAGQGQEADTA
ncbi:MAG: hypothetical protein BWY71_02280 [Planctomycetes bacterium ADurb.Bin412]|nr:MAG: hypothetical protein BWY71_02280 [Planctomycetes bacterium ADurb.Bin412]